MSAWRSWARTAPGSTRFGAVVAQMRDDEARHAQDAENAGGLPMPAPVQALMRGAAKVMTTLAYRI